MEHATDLIHWTDSEGRIAYANETARRYNGYSLEEIQKLHIWDIDANLTEERWPAAWEDVGREGAHTIETMGMRRDGPDFPVEVSSKRIEFEGKEYAVSFSRDITERKLAEQSLRDSEARYRHLFELESDAHMLVDDENYRIIEANEAAVALYGYSREELLAMSFLQLSNDPELSQGARQARRRSTYLSAGTARRTGRSSRSRAGAGGSNGRGIRCTWSPSATSPSESARRSRSCSPSTRSSRRTT